MDLKHLKLIKAIVEFGSISKASKKLFVTSSALSHQLNALETELGCAAFTRSKNKWILTAEGNELYHLAEITLSSMAQTMQRIQQLQNGSKGNIRLSTECYSFYLGLPSFIEQMKWQYPDINISLNLEATHHPISLLLENKLDIALTSQKPKCDKLIGIPIFQDEILGFIHKENPLAQKAFLEATDFKDLHLIIHSLPLSSVSVFNYFLKPHHIEPKHISAIPLTEVALEMVEANMGIACFPKWAVEKIKISAETTLKPLGEKGLKRTHYLVIRAEDQHKKYIKDFTNQFIAKFQQ